MAENIVVVLRQATPSVAGTLYVLRTGCQWNAVPRECGSGKTLHRYFQRWTRAGVFKKLWKSGLEEYAEVWGIDWKWQAVVMNHPLVNYYKWPCFLIQRMSHKIVL